MLTDHAQIFGGVPKIPQLVAAISFFLLFPGFLFYHQFVAMNLMPPFAGGLFGYVSLGTLGILLALFPWNTTWLKKTVRNRYVLFVLVFLFFTSLWTLAHYAIFSDDYITRASIQSAETIILWSCLFLIGLLLPLESGTLRWSFFVSFMAILVFLLHFSISTGNQLYIAGQFYGNTTDVSTYQGFARSVLVILLFLVAVFTSIRPRAFFILGGSFVLFLLGSRSDFYAFLALSILLCVILGVKKPRYYIVLLLLGLEIFILAWPDLSPRLQRFIGPQHPAIVAENPANEKSGAEVQVITEPASVVTAPPPSPRRQFEILELSSSTSWAGRRSLQSIAIEQIAEHPLMGTFGGHVARGGTGSYAHNALSAWVSYGLVGFCMYVSLTLLALLVSVRKIALKQQDTALWTFAFTLNFVCLLLIIASKSVYWPLPALGWGVVAKALTTSKSTS